MSKGDTMAINRIHWFEFHDLEWFPAILRDALTEWLRVLWQQADAYRVIAPILADVLDRSGAAQIVDLCSGGSGPLLGIKQEFTSTGRKLHAIVTDKYPNVAKMEELKDQSHGVIDACLTSVDATHVPRDLTGLRTLFNSFHHFQPLQARQILEDAYRAAQPVSVFEIPNRSIGGITFSFIATFLGVLVMTPAMRPRRTSWWCLTYLLPVIPFIVAWDGWVSHLRAYTEQELLELVAEFNESYRWEVRTDVLRGGRFQLTSLIGCPESSVSSGRVHASLIPR